jgi:hypothetical protein
VILGIAGTACLAWALWAVTHQDNGGESDYDRSRNLAPARFKYETVPRNRDVKVAEGFRGDTHPLLHGRSRLELTAQWSPVSVRDDKWMMTKSVDHSTISAHSLPKEIMDLFLKPVVVEKQHAYAARDFSVFLPVEVTHVGQVWSIDKVKAAAFLKQIHPHPTTQFAEYAGPYGRRPGPAGAFGVVRAISPTHLDIFFRLHAEFVLIPSVVYTPACFLGRMLINRKAGTVDYFQMAVPHDRAFNLTLTVSVTDPRDFSSLLTSLNFEHVEQMELQGGDNDDLAQVDWEGEIDLENAHRKLKSIFFNFYDINWVSFDDVLEIAKEENKPIFAVVVTSALDDQSC